MLRTEGKKVIIFGAGKFGQMFVYRYFREIKIHCFWDNNKIGECLGYPIRKPKFEKGCFIIVAATVYLEMRRQLIDMGYREFEDFIFCELYQKKMAVTYGNCHISMIKNYMKCSGQFTSEYAFYPFPMIQQMEDAKIEYQGILPHCDLFFHQAIRKNNEYGEKCSSEEMLKYVTESCRVISVPNLYGMPKYLFPQIDNEHDWYQGSLELFQIDKNVVSWLKDKKTQKYMMDRMFKIGCGGIYAEAEILHMWEEFKRNLLKREEEWDIKISDYILQNYKKEKLFCDPNHITSRMAKEIALRILKYMGYQQDITIDISGMDTREVPVYQDVKAALGLEFEDDVIRKCATGYWALNSREMTMEEYVDQLCRVTEFYLSREELET